MEDPNLIACLYPYDDDPEQPYALRTIQHALNSSRHFGTQQQRPSPSWGRNSRESTAPLLEDTKRGASHRNKEGLLISFSNGPKGGLGVVFGTVGSRSDILLPDLEGLSGEHAYLTFDPKDRWLILRDCSTLGTIITYNGQGGEKRRNFDWILGGHEVPDKTRKIVIEFHPDLKFQIVVYKHDKYRHQYFHNIDRFVTDVAANNDLPFGGLGIESGKSTIVPSGTQTPSQDSILLDRGTFDGGAFAVVNLVWDVSTGVEYVSKQPRRKYFKKEAWEAEIDIMKQISHDHIVSFKFATKTLLPEMPRMVMEYLPFGNLEDQHAKRRFSQDECWTILLQTLFGLQHLHDNNIVHRDLKPENILVKYRDGHMLHVKIADFGLSKLKEDSYLGTICGTYTYLAPEIAQYLGQKGVRGKYTKAVDIWSLALVISRFAYGHPYPGKGMGTGWCEKVIDEAEAWDSEEMIDFLREHMLVWDAKLRSSVDICIREVMEILSQLRADTLNPRPGSYRARYEATEVGYPAEEQREQTILPNKRDSRLRSSKIERYIRSNALPPDSFASTSILKRSTRPTNSSSSSSGRPAKHRSSKIEGYITSNSLSADLVGEGWPQDSEGAGFSVGGEGREDDARKYRSVTRGSKRYGTELGHNNDYGSRINQQLWTESDQDIAAHLLHDLGEE